ncbi:hypothetical protein SAY87_024401 [Trapa incisa]|uniref:MSP domain-containing protein n=1 Tax=Trapa incisa TaxID=236973 RepID=A0AAN7JFW6_9MYRT|nr:hypothetical protein SAY87_024401 [Trapa incisa]
MSTGELLNLDPLELKFPCTSALVSFPDLSLVPQGLRVELKKQISCSLQLSNKTDSYVAFKVKTTNPKKYCVRPNTGVVLPRSTCDVIVTMQAQKEAPPDMQCKDKFLLQSVKTSDGATAKDITAEMVNILVLAAQQFMFEVFSSILIMGELCSLVRNQGMLLRNAS